MDLSQLDFINNVKNVVITAQRVVINYKNNDFIDMPVQETPKRLNNIELDLTGIHSYAILTGGISGHVLHIHYKDSDRIDAQVFPKMPDLLNNQQGVLGA